MPRWEDSYKIIEKINPVIFKVENNEKNNHFSRTTNETGETF
jgi:hypothetical protein